MSKRKMSDEQQVSAKQEEELTRRRCMLMAATAGLTQTAFAAALVNREWEDGYAGGPLEELLLKQLGGC